MPSGLKKQNKYDNFGRINAQMGMRINWIYKKIFGKKEKRDFFEKRRSYTFPIKTVFRFFIGL